MKLISLSTVPDYHLFWAGAAFRFCNVGMNGVPSDEDFYDYMLVRLDNEQPMLSINVTIGNIKAGEVVCYVTRASENHNTVTAQALHQSIGVENFYYLDGPYLPIYRP